MGVTSLFPLIRSWKINNFVSKSQSICMQKPINNHSTYLQIDSLLFQLCVVQVFLQLMMMMTKSQFIQIQMTSKCRKGEPHFNF